MKTDTEYLSITATLVAEADRLEFLPAAFGLRFLIKGEALVYRYLRHLCAEYDGAFWHFYTLSNSGFYMAPSIDKNLQMVVPGNYFSEEMSADAAGIVATLFALGRLAEEAEGTAEGDGLIKRFHLLMNFVRDHAEAEIIRSAID